MTSLPRNLSHSILNALAVIFSATAFSAESPLFLQPKLAAELSWTMDDQAATVSVSYDGESWETISPTRSDGQKAYWLTTLDKEPLLARKTLADANASIGEELLVNVAQGVRQLKIEIYDEKAQVWKPRVLANLEGGGGVLPFSLNGEYRLSDIRVSISQQAVFDFEFTSIAYEFQNQLVQKTQLPGVGRDSLDFTGVSDESNQSVEESDIWRIQGDRLFFFNQLRGLQVIDLSDPDNPEISHFLKMPAVGQQMYAPSESLAILLASKGYNQRSEVRMVSVEGETIQSIGVVEIPGHIFDSRLIGDRLYTVAYSYSQVESEDYRYFVWEDELLINAIDLSDPANPQKIGEVILPDASATLTATPEYLIIASRNWRQYRNRHSDVFLFSLTDPETPLKPIQMLQSEGVIADKFKMSVDGNILTCISEINTFGSVRQLSTVLETFAISSDEEIELPGENGLPPSVPESEEAFDPNRLGRLVLGEDERLFATRIVGDRAYIVTFFQIDPLWVVDLSNPEKPTITGELEIPGWSTYLQPLGDQLFAVGVEDRRVSVSLFNVADPSNPFLSDRVYLGEEGSYSWSEANYDEKAISILPEQNLSLVPFIEYNSDTFENLARIQLIDFDSGELALRGVIESDYAFRRATVVSEEIVSISNQELLVVDAANRDQPALVSRLLLAWNVDRAIEVNGKLLQLDNGGGYFGSSKAVIRMTSIDDPTTILAEYEIDEGRIAGAVAKGNRLYCMIVQQEQADGSDPWTFEQGLAMKTFEFSSSIEELSTLDLTDSQYPSFEYSAVWLGTDTFVWHGEPNFYYPFWRHDILYPPYWGGSSSFEFFAIRATGDSLPTLLSYLEIDTVRTGENEGSYSILPYISSNDGILNLDSRFYVSYQTFKDFEEEVEISRFMKEVDFGDPANPFVSNPIPIPGELKHLNKTDAGGILVFTTVTDYVTLEDGQGQSVAYLQASAFDGEAVFLLDEIDITSGYYQELDFFENTSFVLPYQSGYGWQIGDPDRKPVLERYLFNQSGAFESLPDIQIESPALEIEVIDQTLYAIDREQDTQQQSLLAYDARDMSANPSLSEVSLDSVFHSLRNLSIGEDSVYFANGVYGVSSYLFNNAFPQDSSSKETSREEVVWSVVSSPNSVKLASSESTLAEWAFAKRLAAEVVYDPQDSTNGTSHLVSDFQVQPALEIPLNAENGDPVSFLESHDLGHWIPHEPVFSEDGSLLFPLVEETPLFIRAAN